MNGTYDGEDSCFNQWQAGIGGLKGGSIRPTASRSGTSSTCRRQRTAIRTCSRTTRNSPGVVNLTSANPRDTPDIALHSFFVGVSGEEDLQARIWPPKQVSSEAKMKQFAEDEARGHHASCIAPIGADDNPQAVLDSNFKVHGVDGLRVVSASIFPKIPGFYVVLGIYMASKKATDVIFAEAQVA
ncbi:Oxygen-dependent choline dehydrogenase [Colletotrichum higginsianum]|uniref:Oxygen-dependent choline dehydrogenase n=1 Tax=Colletotrichum higginsianum TaxID=80884 RepID=A0A4T0WBD1_9PEZI|nr:Oxygen-dependent choline dehydrogenase [Colletotrichum higginsianum]